MSASAPVFKPLRVIGLMSGTSMDGIDAAYLETDGEGWLEQGPAITLPYASDFRSRLGAFVEHAPDRGASPVESGLEAELTDLHTLAVERLLKIMALPAKALDLVGLHGQTIWHRPAQKQTWQMGDGLRLADALGVAVAYDFRSDDVAAGGQGAPLLPIYHAALAQDAGLPVAILNIGGVANITCVGTQANELMGFDTGPGNGLIDDWVRARLGLEMDRDGAVAAKGQVHRALVDEMLTHAFFELPPPKSLDRFAFKVHRLAHLSTEDGAATLTAFTAAAAARAIGHCAACPQKIFVAGGGRHNPTLMKLLAEYTGATVFPVDVLGWNGDALEAQGFAYLAVRCLRGFPLTFPGTTGIGVAMTGGRISAPRAFAADLRSA
jgi:anhydro-N-acetylmuramic acid kinase